MASKLTAYRVLLVPTKDFDDVQRALPTGVTVLSGNQQAKLGSIVDQEAGWTKALLEVPLTTTDRCGIAALHEAVEKVMHGRERTWNISDPTTL